MFPDGDPADLIDRVPPPAPEDLILPQSSGVRYQLREDYRECVYDQVYGDEGQDSFRSALVDAYRQWVDTNVYIAMEHRDPDGSLTERIAVLGAKRGNGPYRARVKARVMKLHDQVNRLLYVGDEPAHHGYRHRRTNMLFLTLTVDPKGLTLYDAWKGPRGASSGLNRVLSSLRGRYGSLAHVRAFESHRNGYPHVHVAVVFMEHSFLVYEKGRGDWRVQRSRYHPDGEQESLKALVERSWGLGNVDISGAVNGPRSVEYIMKYIVGETKGRDPATGEPIRDDLTLSMTWFWNLRTFGASHFDLTLDAYFKKVLQLGLDSEDPDEGFPVVSESCWTLLGVFELQSHGDRPPPWSIDLEHEPELSARVKDLERERRERMQGRY